MTKQTISKKAARESLIHNVATSIRELLDKAQAEYGKDKWTEDEAETRILDLVSGEDDE